MRALAKAAEEGKLQAKYKMIAKQPWGVLVKQYAGEMIKKIDPMKFAATIALTPVVKAAIDTSPQILSMYQTLLTVGSPLIGLIFSEVAGDAQQIQIDETYSWVIAFGLAYVVVENFGEIIAAGQSVGGWVASLIAV